METLFFFSKFAALNNILTNLYRKFINKMRKKLLPFIFSLLAIPASAHDIALANSDGVTIYYNILSTSAYARSVEVTYSGSAYNSVSGEYSGIVNIPNTIKYNNLTYKVVSILEDAFYGCPNVTSVSIPANVYHIGPNAFYGCSKLASVTFNGTGLTEIMDNAFFGCTALTSITLPEGLETIATEAFSGCTRLSSISVPTSVTKCGMHAFEGTAWSNSQPDGLACLGSVAYQYFGTMPEKSAIVIPEGIKAIAGSCFSGCTGMTSVSIPEGVETIEKNAFYNCTGLTAIGLPSTLTRLGQGVFYRCNNLKEIHSLMRSAPETGNNVFYGVSGATLYVPTSCMSSYEYSPWSNFNIVEKDLNESIFFNATYRTFCSPYILDFTSSDVEAYVVSSFDGNTATLTRITKVPAGVGFIVKGTSGSTSSIPYADYAAAPAENCLIGVLSATTLKHSDSNMANYILAGGGESMTAFVRVPSSGIDMAANNAYLQYDNTNGDAPEIISASSSIDGDVNHDGTVNVSDVVSLINIILGQ